MTGWQAAGFVALTLLILAAISHTPSGTSRRKRDRR